MPISNSEGDAKTQQCSISGTAPYQKWARVLFTVGRSSEVLVKWIIMCNPYLTDEEIRAERYE